MNKLMQTCQFLFLCIYLLPWTNTAPLYGQSFTLREVLNKAQQVSPRLQSLEQMVKAKQGAMWQADVHINPSIGINAGNRTQTATLEQELEYPGKQRARTRVAAAGVEITEMARQLAALQIQGESARLFYAILSGEKNIELLRQNLQVNERFLQAARHKFEQGFGSELDVVKGQVEVVRARRLLQTAQQELLRSQNQLKTLLKIPLSRTITLQGDLAKAAVTISIGLDSLGQQTARRHPAIHLQEAEVKAARYRVEVARLSSRPNFNIDFEGGVEDNEAKATVGLSLPLALWDRKKGERAEAKATQKGWEYNLENTRDQIIQEVTTAFQEYHTALATVELFDETLLGKAKEAAEAAQRAFETTGFRFLDLIDAQRTYLDTMLEYNSSLLSLRWAEVNLRISAGEPLTREQP